MFKFLFYSLTNKLYIYIKKSRYVYLYNLSTSVFHCITDGHCLPTLVSMTMRYLPHHSHRIPSVTTIVNAPKTPYSFSHRLFFFLVSSRSPVCSFILRTQTLKPAQRTRQEILWIFRRDVAPIYFHKDSRLRWFHPSDNFPLTRWSINCRLFPSK